MKLKNYTPIIFLAPLLLFLAAHYVSPYFNKSLTSSGFLTGEAPYYMANARQYLDFGFDSIFYSNPFSEDIESKRHYFQFQTYILAILLKVLPFSPGVIWNLFGIIFGLLFIKTSKKLIESKIITKSKRSGIEAFALLCLFFFGGGIHAISGITTEILNEGFDIISILKSTDSLEVADGWWMHSVARNFILPNYIFYYFLVFKILTHIENDSYKSLLWQFILAFSHPFVGVQTIFGICLWKIFELLYLKSKIISKKSLISNLGLLCILLFYYMVFLNLDPEHKQQESQWKTTYDNLYKNWAMLGKNFIPSYILVVLFSFFNIYPSKRFGVFFKNPFYRVLAILGISNFIIANHEFIITPLQPIHFTHGMVWFPFALLTVAFLNKYLEKTKVSLLVIIPFVFIFTLDNSVWYAKRIIQEFQGENQQISRLTKEELSIIEFLKKNFNNKKYLLVTKNENLSYHSSYLTSMSTWLSHKNITPYAFEKKLTLEDFYISQKLDSRWRKRPTIFVTRKATIIPTNVKVEYILKTMKFNIWKIL
jgi:hypothetical protein